MKTIISASEDVLYQAAEQVKEVLASKPDALLALSAGEDCVKLYEKLEKMQRSGQISFARAKIFSVAGFCGEENRRGNAPLASFLSRVDADTDNCVFLSEENLESYDEMIAARGGIDLAVLDIGPNARLGYNEPATPFDSLTHRQKLTDSSRRELAPLFGAEEDVPEYALTMGIKTLVSARNIMLIASGESRAEAVFKMLYGRNDSFVPAAFLQIPLNVTVYLDEASAQKL